jgi:hypothetical protein
MKGRCTGATFAIVLALTACGGDDADTSGTSGADEPAGADSGAPGDDELGEAAVTAIRGEDICALLPGTDVGATLGLTIDTTQAYDTATPQCTYSFTTSTGSSSSVTIASLRGEGDLGGRSGDAAFEYVVETNRGLAGSSDFEEVDLDAGDRAVRFSGEALHLGIVFADGHLLTVIVPIDVTDASRVDDLVDRAVEQLVG